MSKHVAVKLKSKGEKSVLGGHPWVFSNSIQKISGNAETGDLAIIFSRSNNKLIAIGIYDAESPIRIKIVYHGTKSITINSDYFKSQLQIAYNKRLNLLTTETNAYRLIFGENDGFPGLIADIYDGVIVVKLYSGIWFPFINDIVESIIQLVNGKAVVLRLSRMLQQKSYYKYRDGDVIYGTLDSEVVKFIEHGVNFSANVIKGHKTGYFLDHRANRTRVGELSKGKRVLDVFSYAGGFSVHALANEAEEVTSLDISKQALQIAIENGKLNSYSGLHKTIAGDAFEEMKKLIKRNKTYDVVVIDPPSFAKQQSEIELAKKKYAQLAELGAQLTAKHGLLVLASCSSRILAQSFFDLNINVLNNQSRRFETILKTKHDIDHPVGFPEGAYLKCGYYRFLE